MKRIFLLLTMVLGVVACDTADKPEQRGVTGFVVPTAVTRHPPLIITTDMTPTPTVNSENPINPVQQDETCVPNTAWVSYAVSSGDRIYNLAQQVNSTVEEIAQANCLIDPNQLHVGQEIYLPQLPPTSTPVPVTSVAITKLESLYSNTALGGTVSFSWSVEDASRVQVSWQTAVTDPEILLDRVSAQGSYSVRVPEWVETDSITIVIDAWDEAGHAVQKTLDLPITSLDNAGSMTLDETAVPAYSTATLRWDMPQAHMVHLYWYPDQDGRWLQRELLDVFYEDEARAQTKTLLLDDPRAYGEIPLELEVADANGRLIALHTTLLIVTCADNFLVDDATRPIGTCPTPMQETSGAYQQFERGFMVWREDTATIYAFNNDGSYTTHHDTWQEGDTIDLTPPDGLIAPVRGFAKVWQNNPTIQTSLGWAVQNEQLYTLRQQTIDIREWDGTLTGDQYMQLPERVVRLNAPNYTTWEIP